MSPTQRLAPSLIQRIVALETGFDGYAVAFLQRAPEDGWRVADEWRAPPQRKASTHLHADLVQRMRLLGWSFDQPAALAINVGPGGFTGLRVGIATAKGIARACGWPILRGDPLAALAMEALANAAPGQRVISMVDVRKGEVSAQRFAPNAESPTRMEEASEMLTATPERIIERWSEPTAMGPEWVLVGDAVARYADQWRQGWGERFTIREDLKFPSAALMGMEAGQRWLAGRLAPTAPEALIPRYARPSEVEFLKAP